jgi:hypothetical protein
MLSAAPCACTQSTINLLRWSFLLSVIAPTVPGEPGGGGSVFGMSTVLILINYVTGTLKD